LVDHLTLGNTVRAKRPYFFDPASGAPPARELPGIRPPLTARRFSAGAAEAELRHLLRKARAGTLLRSEFGLQGVSGEMLQTTAQHVLRYWCEPPADRRHVRRRLAARVVVVHGFEEVAANVGNMLIEYPFVSDQEIWLCENAAEGGMAALVKSPHGAWVNVGELLAYRYPDSATWNAGIVRHMSEEDDQTMCVGVEAVARGGVAVSVSGGKRRGDVHDDGVLCVWLAEAGCEASQMKLLMPARLYAPSSALEATLYDRRYLLIPLALLESGPDYELGLFKAVRG
jgi:hypothetical protein